MNILVIGTGAVGGFYGGLLARAGCDVSVAARADYTHIRDQGIAIRSETEFGEWTFHPKHTLGIEETLGYAPDLILLCVKLTDEVDRVSILKQHVGTHTTIVLLSNGVDIEEEIAQAFPDHRIISGLAFVCVTRTAPGQIWHQAFGRLALGDYPSGVSTVTTYLVEAFSTVGLECEATSHIAQARWQKCVWNAAFNPLSVLSGGLDTLALLAQGESLIRAIMQEVIHVSAALGYTLPSDLVDEQIEKTRAASAYKTSMLLDFEAGRPLETEAILGNTVRAAKRCGASVPHLETLYTLMQLRTSTRY